MDPEVLKQYGDIIDHPHYVDPARPRMTLQNRAAQFSPFAALTGYEDLIDEAARQTSDRVELDESAKEEIGRRLGVLLQMREPPEARIVRFVRDSRKEGGAYVETQAKIVSYDPQDRRIVTDGGERIPLDDVAELSADCFDSEG